MQNLLSEKVAKRRDAILFEHRMESKELTIMNLAEKLARRELTTAEALRVQGEDFFLRISDLAEAASEPGIDCRALIENVFAVERGVGAALKRTQAIECLNKALSRLQLRLGKGINKELAIIVIRELLAEVEKA